MKTSFRARHPRVRRGTNFALSAVCIAALASVALDAEAGIDYFDAPPPTDPSHYTEQPADPTQPLLDLLTTPEANEGALELTGGVIGDKRGAPSVDNVIQRAALYPFNYPTNGLPSSLFGAQEWTQKLLMFEEFGTEKLDPNAVAGTDPFPRPTMGPLPEQDPYNVAASAPASAALDTFLKQASTFACLTCSRWASSLAIFASRRSMASGSSL